MDGLQAKCEQMCKMGQRGGRCVHTKRNTMRIMDIEKWTSEMTDEVLYYMPNASVDVTACSQSLTGFCVEVRNKPAQYIRAWGWAVCIIAIAVVCIRELQRVL